MDVIAVALTLTIIAIIYCWFYHHDPRFPPCPCQPLPIVGHLLHLDRNFRPTLKKWQQQCGDIYSLYMGPSLVIVLNGYETNKEAFVKNDHVTSDRPPFIFNLLTSFSKYGITFTSGSVWKEQRTVTMNILRTLGVGQNIIAERVTEFAAAVNEALARLEGKPTNINNIITTNVANVICSVLIGERFSHDDVEFVKISEYMREMAVSVNGTQMVNYYPSLLRLPWDFCKTKKLQECAEYILNNFAAKFVTIKGFNEYNENVLDNYVALYVNEMNKKNSEKQETSLNKENLIKNIYDLFAAGMETSSTTLMWCVLYMVNYPLIQQKAYEEIHREVGIERSVKISDQTLLPYVNAVITEVQRLASILPLSVTHLCTDTFTLRGYVIPKGAHLVPNLDSVLFYDKVWGSDPDIFRPERFIDKAGKFQSPAEFIPFSLGKRVCAGEALAKVELFLFFANMLQRFQFVAPDPQSPPPLEPLVGFNSTPVPYQVRVLDRFSEIKQ